MVDALGQTLQHTAQHVMLDATQVCVDTLLQAESPKEAESQRVSRELEVCGSALTNPFPTLCHESHTKQSAVLHITSNHDNHHPATFAEQQDEMRQHKQS
jgi:hypothetical protein